jgi:acetyl-CoA carboxylase biotin carboxyl carrier protein
MDYKQVKELLEWIEKSSFVSVSVSMGDLKVCASKESGELNTKPKMPDMQDGHIVVSPIVGTFYVSASPDSPPFAPVGKAVKKGDVLCILEAMKIMNELVAETDGVIAEVYAKDGAMVEALQPLFKISPKD